MQRIKDKFSELALENKKAFIAYICAGDPDYETSLEILKNLPKFGCDIIEVGVPFLDPSGDGPIIEDASKRAIKKGMNLAKTLTMIKEFRKVDNTTPIVLMSYYNPIYRYGIEKFFYNAKECGIDGILIVDLPLEEEQEVIKYIDDNKLDFIKLISPSTDKDRALKILKNASGFIYLVSMFGITGTKEPDYEINFNNLTKIKSISSLPIAIGFGIKTNAQINKFKEMGFDGVIVGSKIVEIINSSHNIDQDKISKIGDEIRKLNL